MSMDIPKISENGSGLPVSVPCWDDAPGSLQAFVWCSNGHLLSLAKHEIAADGAVSPSVACMMRDCGYHDTIRLVGWTPKTAQ